MVAASIEGLKLWAFLAKPSSEVRKFNSKDG
jgi:hypothetical protein